MRSVRCVVCKLCLAACVLGLAAWSLPPEVAAHSDKAAVAVKTYGKITVDGDLEDWTRRVESTNWAGRLEIKKGDVQAWMRAAPVYLNALTGTALSGAIDGPRDLAATVYTLWDAQRLYVAAVIDDDTLVTRYDRGDIWQDDMLEVLLDCRHDAVTQTLTQDDEYRIGISPANNGRSYPVIWVWENPQAETVLGAVTAASQRTPTGYRIEASVPWEVLQGCQPSVGGLIGFNFSVSDKDGDQPRTVVAWSGSRAADPSQFGHLYLVDAPVDLLASDELRPQEERSTLDVLTGPER